MGARPFKTGDFEERLREIESTIRVVGSSIGVLAEKIGYSDADIFGLAAGISPKIIGDMRSALFEAKLHKSSVQDFINQWREKFPEYKNAFIGLAKACITEGAFAEYCNKILNSSEVEELIKSFSSTDEE